MVQEQVRVSGTWYVSHQGHLVDNHEQAGGGACCKRPRQRGTDASLTIVFGLVATCDVPGTCPTQKLQMFSNLIQMGPQNKSRISEIPDRGDTLTSSKKTGEKNDVLHSYEYAPAEYWYVPRVIYAEILSNSTLLFILTWGGVWCRFLVLLSTPA